MLGISPSGYPSYASSLYVGRVGDKKITRDCGILDLLEPGDQIMADRGFDIEDDLPTGVTLNIPPFLNGHDQLTLEEEVLTRKIASSRIHVERAIAQKKNYRLSRFHYLWLLMWTKYEVCVLILDCFYHLLLMNLNEYLFFINKQS